MTVAPEQVRGVRRGHCDDAVAALEHQHADRRHRSRFAASSPGCEVDAELDAVEAAASRFRDGFRDQCARSVIRAADEVSELLAEMLAAALNAARRTDGDVDPTVGAAVIALGYDGDIATLDRVDARAARSRFRRDGRWSPSRTAS